MFYKQNHIIDIRFSLKYGDGNRSGYAMHLKSPKSQNDSNYNVFRFLKVMFWGVPRGVLLEQNEGPEDLLFFEVPRGSFWGSFGVVLGSNIDEN